MKTAKAYRDRDDRGVQYNVYVGDKHVGVFLNEIEVVKEFGRTHDIQFLDGLDNRGVEQ